MSGLGFFAGWTGGSVPLTLAGADFSLLWIAAGIGALGAIGGASVGHSLGAARSSALAPFQMPSRSECLALAVGVGVFFLAAAYFVKTSQAFPLWLVMLMLAATSLWSMKEPVVTATDAAMAEASIWATGLLAFAIVLGYVLLHRPDADDAFYLNLPLGLLERQAGMMVHDTMYGDAGWPLLGSNYRVEALPTLIAAIAKATGLSVIAVAHALLPVFWCIAWTITLVILGLRYVGNRWWIFACLSVLATMAFGGTLQTWGVHGLARMFHGKGPLLLIAVPLIIHVVLLYRQHQLSIRQAWCLITILEIAALGLTANAIYIAPMTLCLAVFATFIFKRDVYSSLILMSPAIFPLSAGLWLIFFDPPRRR